MKRFFIPFQIILPALFGMIMLTMTAGAQKTLKSAQRMELGMSQNDLIPNLLNENEPEWLVERTSFGVLPSRVLEEEQLSSGDNVQENKKKPSLSIGKVLGQVYMSAYAIKLSKNGKVAFVATNSPSALKIIDISDSESPVVLSTLALSKESYSFKGLIVSPDETKIYISNFEDLEVIDISDFKSPVYLAKIEDKVKIYETDSIYEPNLLMSKDAQFLFVSGFGLQVFDISKPITPILIRSIPSRINSGKLIPSSIALSQEGKILYYTDGSLWIYNVENPRDLKILSSFNTTTFLISSMILSKDFKSAFVLGLDNEESNILIQKLDTQDIHGIKEGQIIQLKNSSSANPVFLSQTPNNFFLQIRFLNPNKIGLQNLLIFDTQSQQVVHHEKILVEDSDKFVFFTEDSTKMIVGSKDKLKIVELYLDYPNKNAFTESSQIIQTSDLQVNFLKTTFAPSNENIFYSLSDGDSRRFGVHRVSANFEQVSNISFYETGEQIKQNVISQDNKRAFLVSHEKIFILDISNPENPVPLGRYGEEEESGYYIDNLILSRDGKTGFVIQSCFGKYSLAIIDFSDPKNPTQKGLTEMSDVTWPFKPVLSKDERTVFIITRILSVYNVSDHSFPAFLTSVSFLGKSREMLGAPHAILSSDGKTLFFKEASTTTYFTVKIIDVTNVTSPQVQSEFSFPFPGQSIKNVESVFASSSDSRTFYILKDFHLIVMNVTNVSSPRYLGAIKILDSSESYITYFKLSHDGHKAYFFTQDQKLHVVSLQPTYSTFLKQDIFKLGASYNIDLQVLEMNKKSFGYDRIGADYRFTKFAIVESRSTQDSSFEDVVLKMPPSWLSFDLKSQSLSVEARKKNEIGTYRAYFGFSTRVPKNAFDLVNKNGSTENLLTTLLALDYIDNQLFLTENFEGLEDFMLPDQYSSLTKEEIYNILKGYSFGTFSELNIVQSLGLGEIEDKKVRISTASLANLKVEINLLKSDESKFLSRYYGSLLPTITENKSRLVMEGSLKDVNLALQQVVINLGNAITCDGEIIIDDKLNPIMTKSMKNISVYFNHNKPPELNKDFSLTIQSQIAKEVVWTGQYFQIKLNQKTFFDHFTDVENLNYQLIFVKNNNETTVLPTWLSFSDMTLMGTAPEEIFNRDFDFKLVVKNEFQEYKEPLKIHVKISSNFVLKLLMKYSPYILSIVGLLISANKIFNILFKSTYKHPKDFVVKVGEEITSEIIFPVSFIREEMQEAKTIMKILQKNIGNKEKLLSGERKLDKLAETINTTLNELSYKEQEELDFYLEGHTPRTLLVNQIIFNMFTMNLLQSQEEKETKIYYEKVKKHWVNFVEWDLTNSCFKINEKTFRDNCDEKQTTISTGLIDKSNINFDLLKDAILAYAFDCQNLDIFPESLQFKVKIKRKANSLKRFFKSDLKDCPFSENGKIGYGIRYHREFDTLFFSGRATEDIQSQTIVFQITDLRQRILKELWIFGKGDGSHLLRKSIETVSYNKTEFKARGGEYQIL